MSARAWQRRKLGNWLDLLDGRGFGKGTVFSVSPQTRRLIQERAVDIRRVESGMRRRRRRAAKR